MLGSFNLAGATLLECACPSGPIAQPFLKLTGAGAGAAVYFLPSFSFQPNPHSPPVFVSQVLGPQEEPHNQQQQSCVCLTASSSLPRSWLGSWLATVQSRVGKLNTES